MKINWNDYSQYIWKNISKNPVTTNQISHQIPLHHHFLMVFPQCSLVPSIWSCQVPAPVVLQDPAHRLAHGEGQVVQAFLVGQLRQRYGGEDLADDLPLAVPELTGLFCARKHTKHGDLDGEPWDLLLHQDFLPMELETTGKNIELVLGSMINGPHYG